MRRNTITALDRYVSGTDPNYSPAQVVKALGEYDRMALQIVADKVGGTTPTLAAKLQTSNDGRNWVDKPAGLAATTIAAGQVNALAFADCGVTPSEAYCRLKVTLGGTSPKARIRASATVRDCKGGPWLPPSETGLAQWLRGGDWTLDGSGDIATWSDLSGNGRDFTTPGNAPSPDGSVAGQPAANFDFSSNEYVEGPSFSSLSAAEIFIVLEQSAATPGASQTGLWLFGSNTPNGDFVPFWTAPYDIYDSFGSTVRKQNISTSGYAWNQPTIYGVRSAASDWSNHLNGVELHQTSTNTVGWDATQSWLGKNLNGYYGFDGAIAEVVIYDRVLDGAPRRNVMQYLGGKYGIDVP